jgi:MYXO-CTERM domain-containing protein
MPDGGSDGHDLQTTTDARPVHADTRHTPPPEHDVGGCSAVPASDTPLRTGWWIIIFMGLLARRRKRRSATHVL